MKIIYILLLFTNILFSNQNSIKIAISNDMIPYAFMDEYNEPKGMIVDYWNLWASKTNQNIEFVPSSWSNTLKLIKSGKVDIHSGLFIDNQRKKYINFLKPIYGTSSKIFIKRINAKKITKITQLDNKKIGLIYNSYFSSYIKLNYPNIKIEVFNTYEKMINALFENEIDAIIGDHLALQFQFTKKNKHNNVTSLKKFSFVKSFYSGISKKQVDTKFHKLVLSGINKISDYEIKTIEKKWITDVGSTNKIMKKSLFTKEELIYIKDSPTLKVALEDWKPIIYNKNGKMNGIAGEILTKVFKTSGLKIKFTTDTWTNLLKRFKQGDIDILPTTAFTKDRLKYGLFSKKYLTLNNSIYVKNTNLNTLSFQDLNNKKIAIVKDFASIEFLKNKLPNIRIIETASLEESIQKVLIGEVDAFFETQIIAENKIKELLVKNLKEIPQSDIGSYGLNIFSKKNDFILQSILQKSLDNISYHGRNLILEKWLMPKKKKELNVAFGKNREPYIITKSYLKGIEYDLINNILNKSEMSIKNIIHLEYKDLQNSLKDDNSLDMAVTVKRKDDKYYYSNDIIEFNNIAVSRKIDNFIINGINDLQDKKVGSSNSTNIKDSYIKYDNQELQVKDFIEKRLDLIVLDKNIFLWYLKKLSNDKSSEYSFHKIFQKINSYKVAFRDEHLRNIFNKNLNIMKQNNEVEDIFNNYIIKDIEAKVKINSLISTIISKYIFTKETSKLDKIVDKFSSLSYIKKLEVYNNRNILLSTSLDKKTTNYTIQNSYYTVSNIPTKVGYIKVFFDEDILRNYSRKNQIIPTIDTFNYLESFAYIKQIYKRFGYLRKELIFTKQEKNYIKNNNTVTFSESQWDPLFIVKKNHNYSGIIGDYLKIVEEKTGLYFKFIKSNTWIEAVNKYKNNEVQVLPSMNINERNAKNELLTNSYTSFNFAIVTGEKGIFADGIKDLKGKTLALPFGFAAYNYIKKEFPNIKIIEAKDNFEAMDLVSRGKADAFVGHMAVAIHNIKHYFQDLKIVGLSKYEYKHQFLVHKTDEILLSILNKVIASITHKQRAEIKEKWIKTKINTEVDYGLLYKISIVFIIILIIILYFTSKLSVAKNAIVLTNNKLKRNIIELNNIKEEMEDSNHEIEISLENLKKTQKRLVESEKMASLGALVAGIAHEINTPIGIGLTGSTHFIDSTKQIIEKFENQVMTESDFKEYIGDSLELANLIYTNLDRIKELINSFKQISVDQTSEQKRKFELNKYINKVLVSIGNVLKKTNIKVIITENEKIILNSYPGAISQVISNLIFNSLNHAFEEKENGTISICLKQEDKKTVIIYKDDGKGISSENLSKIFDPFFTTNREYGGTGLGLNIIYNIITTQLNGTITCKSKENIGVEFIIKF